MSVAKSFGLSILFEIGIMDFLGVNSPVVNVELV